MGQPAASEISLAETRRMAALPPRPGFREGTSFAVVVIENFAELAAHLAAWDDLSSAAIEPNVFYESWMLLPALQAYGDGQKLLVLLIFAQHPAQRRGQPLLCGLFPLERQNSYKKIPISVMSFWNHIHGYLGVPLVRAGFERECLRVFFDWLATDRRGAALLECAQITGDGPFYHLLLEHLQEHSSDSLSMECHTRALLRAGTGDGYLQTVLSGDKRRKLRRAEERLAEEGVVQYLALENETDVEIWLREFLRLEASGWKGRDGTALTCLEADRIFFEQAVKSAFQRRQLMMLALHVGGKPIAHLCNFLAGEGSFAFKVAFDEAYARFSPGVLLELENVRRMHARPEMRWMDSCMAAGGASIIPQLWSDRRVIQTLLVATGRTPGPLVLATLPLLRWLRRLAGSCYRWISRLPAGLLACRRASETTRNT